MKQQQRGCAPSGALTKRESKLYPPGSAQGLSNFLRDNLKRVVPDVHVCGHHAAPMDYLWHAYSRDFAWMRSKHPQASLVGVLNLQNRAKWLRHGVKKTRCFAHSLKILISDDWKV
jgi:hypothetical protein